MTKVLIIIKKRITLSVIRFRTKLVYKWSDVFLVSFKTFVYQI